MDISNLLQNISLNRKTQILENINTLPKVNNDQTLASFLDGEIVKGEVVDIKGLVANILTSKGNIINGHLQNVGQLNIGDERSFLVKNENGILKFGIVSEDETNLYNNNLKKELLSQGLKADGNDIETAKSLIKNELPVNKETLTNLSRAMSLLSKDDKTIDKALFMLKNEISVNKKNATLLDDLVNKQSKMVENTDAIEEGISNIKDPKLKDELVKLFTQTQVEEETLESVDLTKNTENLKTVSKEAKDVLNNSADVTSDIADTIENTKKDLGKEALKEVAKTLDTDTDGEIQSNNLKKVVDGDVLKDTPDIAETVTKDAKDIKDVLKFDLKGNNPKDIDEFLNKLDNKIDKAIKMLENSPDEGAKKLLETLTSHKENVDFMQHIKNNLYLQLPLNINNQKMNGELLVFKDKKRKSGSSKNGVSAIIGLDTVNLGRFETYVQKIDNKINLQFRLENDDIINITKENFSKLEKLFTEHNLAVDSVTYKTINQSFTVVSTENDILSENSENNSLPSYKFNVKL